MKKIDIEMVKLIHQLIVEQSGGSVGVLNENLLDLVANHSLVDGNKRIGMHVMILFLELNGVYLNYEQDELVKLGVGVGAGEIGYEGLLEWVRRHKYE